MLSSESAGTRSSSLSLASEPRAKSGVTSVKKVDAASINGVILVDEGT
jgi:hypothetical protein